MKERERRIHEAFKNAYAGAECEPLAGWEKKVLEEIEADSDRTFFAELGEALTWRFTLAPSLAAVATLLYLLTLPDMTSSLLGATAQVSVLLLVN